MNRTKASSFINHVSPLIMAIVLTSTLSLGPLADQAIAATCNDSSQTNQIDRAAIVKTAYENWKSVYVVSDGNGSLRVQRSDFDNYDTVSEGIAYGMLFAVYNNDKTTFDGLWSYAKKNTNQNGVMNWRIAANGATTGYNGATDADEDIAAALIAADKTWGGYQAAANRQIDIIKRYQVEAGSNVLKPGDVWGGSSIVNPSYIAPSYYDVFQSYRSDTDWAAIKAANYRVLHAAQNKSTGLMPDWSTAAGAPVSGMSYEYGYDASRAPLRLALSAAWYCDANATNLLTPLNNWFAKQDLSLLASSYTLAGTVREKGDAIPLLAAAAAAATTSSNETYRAQTWSTLVNTKSTSYYPDSMRLFGLMVAGGVITNPLNLSLQQPVAATPTKPAPTFAAIGSDVTATVNEPTDLTVAVNAPNQRKDLIIDLELYDANGQRVAQQVYENQSLTTDVKQYSLRWTAQNPGTYTLKTGIFTANWSQNLHWNDRAALVTSTRVVAPPQVVTPTPTPVAPPVTTPTPTPAQPVTPIVTQPVIPAPPQVDLPPQLAAANLSIWWPGSNQAVSGVQPFKAVIDGRNIDSYEMYWQVDGGGLNRMDSIHDNAPHKLSSVNLQGWRWSNNNRYTINFVAKDASGNLIAQKATVITIYN